MKRLPIILLVLSTLVACATGREIGSKDLLDFTPSPSASPTVARKASVKPAPKKKKPAALPAPQPVETKAPEHVIEILGGQCGLGKCGFDPQVLVAAKGTKIIVRNTDTEPRSFVTNDGTYDSGLIQPGKTYTFVAGKVGRFPFTDSLAAPYQNGELVIQQP